jgi:hypothetical protein
MREVTDTEGDRGVGDIPGDRPNGAEGFLNIQNGNVKPATAFFHSEGSN